MSTSHPKEVTRERAETMLARAIEGSRRLGMDDVADRYASLSVDDYAEEKGLRLINSGGNKFSTRGSTKTMANEYSDPRTKAELSAENEGLLSIMDDIWDAVVDVDDDSTKEQLSEAAEEVAAILNDYDGERFPMHDESEEGEEEVA